MCRGQEDATHDLTLRPLLTTPVYEYMHAAPNLAITARSVP